MLSSMRAVAALMAVSALSGRHTYEPLMRQDKRNEELVGTKGLSKVEERMRQAALRRSRMKVTRKAATNALVTASQEQLVLGHIHPRWLRAEVERRLDAGEEVSFALVDQLRAEGPK